MVSCPPSRQQASRKYPNFLPYPGPTTDHHIKWNACLTCLVHIEFVHISGRWGIKLSNSSLYPKIYSNERRSRLYLSSLTHLTRTSIIHFMPCKSQKKLLQKHATGMPVSHLYDTGRIKTYTMPAVCRVERKPQIMADTAILAMSLLLLGASAPKTPIWMPRDPRLANPQTP